MASNDPNFPDPKGPKPDGISDSAWYGYTQVDSTKPLSQWKAWDQYYDPTATGYARYKSDKVDENGNPVQGLFEHPDSAPAGYTAFGQNQVIPISDPRIQGAWNSPAPTPTPTPITSSQTLPGTDTSPNNSDQQSPILEALLKLLSGNQQQAPPPPPQPTQPTGPTSTGNPLQDALLQSFGNSSGMFGLQNGREGKSLTNGGLLWDDNGMNLSNWGSQGGNPNTPPFGAPTPKPLVRKPPDVATDGPWPAPDAPLIATDGPWPSSGLASAPAQAITNAYQPAANPMSTESYNPNPNPNPNPSLALTPQVSPQQISQQYRQQLPTDWRSYMQQNPQPLVTASPNPISSYTPPTWGGSTYQNAPSSSVSGAAPTNLNDAWQQQGAQSTQAPVPQASTQQPKAPTGGWQSLTQPNLNQAWQQQFGKQSGTNMGGMNWPARNSPTGSF